MKNILLLQIIFLFIISFLSITETSAQMTLNFTNQVNHICNGNDCYYSGPSILINEVLLAPLYNNGSLYGCSLTDPAGSEAGEWIELYNPDLCQSVDISCYFLGTNTKDKDLNNNLNAYGGGFTIPSGTVVPPGGFVVIRGVNATPVPSNLLLQNGGKTIEIIINNANNVCIGGGFRLWFADAGSWMAFYDSNGVPQDAISWNNINNQFANFGGNPCLANNHCFFNGTLASYNSIPTSKKTYISSNAPSAGQSFRRIPDGGAWVINTPASPTLGNCNTTCNTAPVITCDGSATVTVSGGISPYTYIWNDSQATTTSNVSGLCAGTYCVTVTDANNNKDSACVTIFDFVPSVTFDSVPVQCSTGTIANLTPFTSPTGGVFSGNGVISANFNPVVAGQGVHTLAYIYVDPNTCTDTVTRTITVDIPPIAPFIATSPICFGDTCTVVFTGIVSSTSVFNWNFNGGNIISGSGAGPYKIIWVAPGSYNITLSVTENACPSAQSSQAVLINMQPILTITNPAAVCFPNTIDLTNASITIGSTNNCTFSYWSNASATSLLSTPSAVATNGTFYIQATTNVGCSTTKPVITTINSVPTSTFTLSPIACYSDASTVIYTGTGTSSGIYTWNFSGGTAIPGSGSEPQSVTWSTTGQQFVSLTVSQNGCISPIATESVINPTPIISTITHSNNLCFGDHTATASVITSEGTPPYTCQWQANSNWNQSTITGLLSGLSSVTVTDSNGCFSFINFTITEPDKLSISSLQDKSICPGTSVTLAVSGTGGTPPYMYHWSNNHTGEFIAISPSNNTTYSCYITDANGCISNTVFSKISILPSLSAEAHIYIDSICPGDSTQIFVSISQGNPPYLFILQDESIVSSPFWVSPDQTEQVSVFVKDNCDFIDSNSVLVNVFPKPPAIITSDKYAGCTPLTVHFVEPSLHAGQSYLWCFGDPDENNLSFSKNPIHVFDVPGQYAISLLVTSSNGCKTYSTITDMITVYPLPESRFIYNPILPNIINPLVSFTNLSSGNEYNFWSFGDGDSSTIINPDHVYQQIGNHNVSLVTTTDKGCKDTLIITVRIEDYYTLYAPTAFSPDGDGRNDVYNVYGSGIMENDYMLNIYNRWGEIIFTSNNLQRGWDGTIKGEMSQIDSYVWIAIFKDFQGNGKTATGKFTLIK